jgi:hypothetical protein
MSLWFAGFRNLLPSALTQNLRVPSGTYTFMSLDPNSDSTPRLVSFHEDLAPSPRAAERPLSIIERIAADARRPPAGRRRAGRGARALPRHDLVKAGGDQRDRRHGCLPRIGTENSPNVSGDDRSVMLLPGPIGLAAQVEEEAENAVLRRQLIILRRNVRGRVHLTNGDRLFLVQLYRWFPSVLKSITIIQPETLVRWPRAGFRRYLPRAI